MSMEAMTEVWKHSPAKGATLLLLLAIADNANDAKLAWPSIDTLAAKTRQTSTTVRSQLRKLEAAGLLERNERPGRSSMYRILTPPKNFTPPKTPPLPNDDFDPSRRTSPPLLRDTLYPSYGAGDEPNEPIEPIEEPTTRTREELFEEFWEVYPLKNGKAKARDAFERALKKVSFGTILEGARRYRDDPNRNPGYTKWAQGWLNDERWSDGPLPQRESVKPSRLDATHSVLEMGRRMQAGQTQLEMEK